jgi:hypothetical protein
MQVCTSTAVEFQESSATGPEIQGNAWRQIAEWMHGPVGLAPKGQSAKMLKVDQNSSKRNLNRTSVGQSASEALLDLQAGIRSSAPSTLFLVQFHGILRQVLPPQNFNFKFKI